MLTKILGFICVVVGGILTFSLFFINVKNMNIFLTSLLGGPTLIYLGLKLLKYI